MKKMKPGIILKLFHLFLYFAISCCQTLQQRQRWHKYEFKDKLFQELNIVLWSGDFWPL